MVNPMFNDLRNNDEVLTRDNVATYRGITIKTLIFMAITIVAALGFAAVMWKQMLAGRWPNLIAATFVFSIIAFISARIGRTNPRASFGAGVIYAVCEGGILGMISLIGEIFYPGIALIACIATVVVFFVMLAVFASGIIRNKTKFVSFGITLGASTIVLLLVTSLLAIFVPSIAASLPILVLTEVLVTIYACVCLLMNFIEATTLVQAGFTKDYEWSCAFGLMVSIILIYIQILRILMMIFELTGRNN